MMLVNLIRTAASLSGRHEICRPAARNEDAPGMMERAPLGDYRDECAGSAAIAASRKIEWADAGRCASNVRHPGNSSSGGRPGMLNTALARRWYADGFSPMRLRNNVLKLPR